MQKGDIDNSVQTRALFVWDGLLATPPEGVRYRALMRARQFRLAFQLWQPNEHMEAALRLYRDRHDVRVDVVVHHPAFVDLIRERYEVLSLGVAHVFFLAPEKLARTISQMNDVVVVFFHSEKTFDAQYGPKGRPIAHGAAQVLA